MTAVKEPIKIKIVNEEFKGDYVRLTITVDDLPHYLKMSKEEYLDYKRRMNG